METEKTFNFQFSTFNLRKMLQAEQLKEINARLAELRRCL